MRLKIINYRKKSKRNQIDGDTQENKIEREKEDNN